MCQPQKYIRSVVCSNLEYIHMFWTQCCSKIQM